MKRAIREHDPPVAVNHEQTILHRRKDCFLSSRAFAGLPVKFSLSTEDIFQRDAHALRFFAAFDQECLWSLASPDLPNEPVDLSPGRNPFAPDQVYDCNCRSNNRAK